MDADHKMAPARFFLVGLYGQRIRGRDPTDTAMETIQLTIDRMYSRNIQVG